MSRWSKSHARSRVRAVVAVVALGTVIGACGESAAQDDTTRNDDGEVVEGGDVGTLNLEVGDCLAEQVEGEVVSVPVVPCSEPHSSELFHSFQIDGNDFPGDDAVRTIASETCIEAFDAFIGLAHGESRWDITAVFPTEATWDQLDDREVICGVVPLSGESTTGSARGIAE